MRLPIPTNRLVALTLLGAILTTAVAVGLAVPSALAGDDGQENAALPADAPTPNENFTPAVQTSNGGYEEEHEEYGDDEDEEHEEYGDDEDEEHEEEDEGDE